MSAGFVSVGLVANVFVQTLFMFMSIKIVAVDEDKDVNTSQV